MIREQVTEGRILYSTQDIYTKGMGLDVPVDNDPEMVNLFQATPHHFRKISNTYFGDDAWVCDIVGFEVMVELFRNEGYKKGFQQLKNELKTAQETENKLITKDLQENLMLDGDKILIRLIHLSRIVMDNDHNFKRQLESASKDGVEIVTVDRPFKTHNRFGEIEREQKFISLADLKRLSKYLPKSRLDAVNRVITSVSAMKGTTKMKEAEEEIMGVVRKYLAETSSNNHELISAVKDENAELHSRVKELEAENEQLREAMENMKRVFDSFKLG